MANIFNIDNIYFDFGHTNIRKDASVQLAKIVAFLEDNPTLKNIYLVMSIQLIAQFFSIEWVNEGLEN